MIFRSTLMLTGKTTTAFVVPSEIVESLGAGQSPPVVVTFKGYTYRTSIGSRGGEHLLPVSAERRKEAGVEAGDEMDVDVVLDQKPREVTVPPDLRDALKGETDAKRFFEGLSFSQKSWFVTWIEGAKKTETRQRRVGEAVDMLREGKTSKTKR